MVNILITDANYKHSLGIVRSLGKRNIRPFILSHKKNSLCGYSKFSNEEIIIDIDYTKEELLKNLIEYEIELIIIVGTNSFKKIVPWKNELKENNINMITVDLYRLELAFSKKATYSLAEKLGIPIAKTFYPQSIEEIDNLKNKITYPCVIKGLYEVGGNIVDYSMNADDLKDKYINICHKYKLTTGYLPMLQEYIPGAGCAFFSAYDNGKCVISFQHLRVREYPVSGGASVCAESYKNEMLEKYGKKLLDSLKWHGVAMVEFKLNKDNVPILMEINPKFWGSIDLALEAGVDFANVLVDIHLGNKINYSNKYKYPFKYHWPLNGDILHGIDNPKAILSIVKDILNPNVKSNIWLSDFYPTYKLFIDFIKSIIIKIVRRGK